ncbi:YncE family protein [Acetobacteraceae bacterium ESL0709]|nr:YncE family protein [Acetobacteraceae bacterium ESL0697]MDF7678944.1 YncE family protein [Acetobacteraceae bacterium ESL0709]
MKCSFPLMVACAFVSLGVASAADDYQSVPYSAEGSADQYIDGMPIVHQAPPSPPLPVSQDEQPKRPLGEKEPVSVPPFSDHGQQAVKPVQPVSVPPVVNKPVEPPPVPQHVSAAVSAVPTIPGMPPVINAHDIYSEIEGPDKLSPIVKNHLERVYVPNLRSNTVSVIDPKQMKVVDTLQVGYSPQHVVPSWDLRTLWVTNNSERRTDGSLTPINPETGKTGPSVTVDDPYNMYFTPDGKDAIVVAEAHRRLDFRDPHTMALKGSLKIPACDGINHAAFSIDGRYAIFTCEFGQYIAKVDTVNRKLIAMLKLSKGGMPQDVLTARDGHKFYVADMMADGVFIIDGDHFREIGFIPTGIGTHGLYPSRDGSLIYAANRGSHEVHGPRHGAGSVSVISAYTEQVVATWPIPGGGSPDMGNVSADGRTLWLSGRFDDVVYAIDTQNGAVQQIPVGAEPHGLTVWPQPGRYSVGHTGIMR